jgi:hypothetical protein
VEQSRRQFLKRSAIVGGAVWAAPAIATVSSALATSPAPGCTTCSGQGTGALAKLLGGSIIGGPLGQGSGQPDNCVATGSIPGVLGFTAICGGFTGTPTCTGDSHVAGNPITVLGPGGVTFTSLSTTAHQSSTCVNTGQATFANLTLPSGNVVNSTPGPNTNVINVPGAASVTLNRQCCDATGNFTVRGLEVILLPGTALSELIVLAESKVGGCGCACTLPACAT